MHVTTHSTRSTFSHGQSMTGTTIPRGPPGVVTYRYQHEKGSEMAYVALADSHEEAQVAATRALAGLAGVDPRSLAFAITIRYRRTNEKQEIVIAPGAWSYVTSRLVPYRLIDVHVVGPSSPPPSPPSPPKSINSLAPPYPDTPPPRYPGSTHKYMPLPPEDQDYGYGYGEWRPPTGAHHTRNVNRPSHPQLDPGEMADRRSMGWSASSIKAGRPVKGTGLFGRFKQNGFGLFPIFPITWDDQLENQRRRRDRGRSHRLREKERLRNREQELEQEEEEMQYQHERASGGGHSYVPSLI